MTHPNGLETQPSTAIGQKSSPSYKVKDGDISRAVAAITNLPSSTLPDSPFIRALGDTGSSKCPTTNWHPGAKSLGGIGTHPVRKQGGGNPCTDASRLAGPHPERWQRNAH